MKLLAYLVQDDEGLGGIVFAKSNAHGRRLGAAKFGDGDFDWGTARRAPWADAHYPTVPIEVMLDQGWWYECTHCGQRISDQEYDDETDEEIHFDPVLIGDAAYCRPACRNAHMIECLRVGLIEQNAIYGLSQKLLSLFPGIWLVGKPHAYVRGISIQQCVVEFRFPGCKIGNATYGWHEAGQEPQIGVCNGDKAAWDAWRQKEKAA